MNNRDNSGNEWWDAVKATVSPLSAIGRRKRARVGIMFVPEPRMLDLHGMTVQQAYEATIAFIDQSEGSVTIVTGKSGQINQEFYRWLEGNEKVSHMAYKGDGGSYRILLGNRKKGRSKEQ